MSGQDAGWAVLVRHRSWWSDKHLLADLLPDDWSALISRQASTCRSLPDAGSRATSRQASTCDLLPERSRMIHRSSFSHPPTQLNGRGTTTSSEVAATGGVRRAGGEAGRAGARCSALERPCSPLFTAGAGRGWEAARALSGDQIRGVVRRAATPCPTSKGG